MTIITPIPALKDNYIWAIVDEISKNAVIVDPGEAQPVIDFLNEKGLSLKAILLTHHHWDHTNGVRDLSAYYQCRMLVGPAHDHIPLLTHALDQDDAVTINDFPLNFKVIAIPGHTNGHIAYYTPGMLFCGDTLFAAGCGRAFEGTPETLYHSLQKLANYPAETKIYCAHEYTENNLRFAACVEPDNLAIKARIAAVTKLLAARLPSLPSQLNIEKGTNPFLRCHVPEVIKSVEKHYRQSFTSPIEVFAHLRQWKDVWVA